MAPGQRPCMEVCVAACPNDAQLPGHPTLTVYQITLLSLGGRLAALPTLPCRPQFKFIVDGDWRYDPNQKAMYDEMGNINNTIEVQEYVPENLDNISGFEPPPSPPARWVAAVCEGRVAGEAGAQLQAKSSLLVVGGSRSTSFVWHWGSSRH